jgi:integrase
LKYKNIDADAITFIRAKTARKKKANITEILIPLTPQIAAIIDRWGAAPKLPDNYIFPILKPDCTPTEERTAVVNTTSAINRVVKDISKTLEINKNISCYTARHSWATIMKKSGASVEFIAEALGHSDTKVTQNYLESFEIDAKRKMAEVLTNF